MKKPTIPVLAAVSLLFSVTPLDAQTHSFAWGPGNGFAGTASYSGILAGSHSTIAGQRSVILGGYQSYVGDPATYNTILGGYQSSILCHFAVVSGYQSHANATASYSFAMGYVAKALAPSSFSFGSNSTTNGAFSFAFGDQTTTNGAHSLAFGNQSQALASHAIAMGDAATASASGSLAIGIGAASNSFRAMALGPFPVLRTDASATTWVPTDPLLTVSNGEDDNERSNAMVVLKNGAVLIKPSGDLSMGEFTEGIEPDDATVPTP